MVVKLGLAPRAIDQRYRPGDALRQQVQDHRARTRKAGTTGKEQVGQLLCHMLGLAHKKAPVRATKAHRVAQLQHVVNPAGCGPARDASNIELDLAPH